MTDKYIGALDQGTTSSRFFIFDHDGRIVSYDQREHKQIYPQPGWVEHNPIEIWNNTCLVMKGALDKADIPPSSLAALGITNQRETTVCWNRDTGKPYGSALCWQDTRTRHICDRLAEGGGIDRFRKKTGLPLATYFSASKLNWLLDNTPGLIDAASRGEALFGTIDSWLVWRLTGGTGGGRHLIDISNASRTLLFNLNTLLWDEDLLRIFGVPQQMLPTVCASVDPEAYGTVKENSPLPQGLPITAVMGDQQASLFGHCCFDPGETKNTYGTGCFLLTNTAEMIVSSKHGLISTVGYQIENQPVIYALEGSIAVAGALVQWFRDNLCLINDSPEIESLASEVTDNGGLYYVPAFSGLFAPHWDSRARGIVAGITHSTNRSHLARAVLEATAFQTKEIFEAVEKDMKIKIPYLLVDGGMVENDLLMQFQADILDVPIIQPAVRETTALGAGYAAGLAVGFWRSRDELREKQQIRKRWESRMNADEREKLFSMWQRAVKRASLWLDD